MKLTFKALCFLLSLCLCYCSTSQKDKMSSRVKDFNKKYNNYKTYFPKEFIAHFPNKINRFPVATIVDTSSSADHIRFMLYCAVNRHELDSILMQYETNSIAKYNANDSCLLVVNRFTTNENRHLRSKHKYVEREKISRECYNGKQPIPNFFDSQFLSGESETKLPKDFTLYVLDAKSGKFWDESHITRGQYMPQEWKNGYSRGVAISKKKKTIIYWFIIW